jgi:hypothetical protein
MKRSVVKAMKKNLFKVGLGKSIYDREGKIIKMQGSRSKKRKSCEFLNSITRKLLKYTCSDITQLWKTT